jgi:guanine deaminase
LGSTTVAYNSSIHPEATNILADACIKAGQRAIIGKMCIVQGSTHGNWEESNQASIEASENSVQYIRNIDPDGRLVKPCVQPRGGPYCPPELMKAIGQQSQEYKTHVQAHMCETPSDIERTLKLHPGYDCYSDMYNANNLLHDRTILAHCIHLQPKDFENLKQTGAGVAHNPISNTCLRDGECRVRDLLDAGIKVGLGTDCSAGYMPSIHDAMRNASNVSRHLAMHMNDDRFTLGFSEIVYLATMGGARVVGMEDRIGSFKLGKKFDALVIDVEGIISVDSALWEGDEEDSEAMVKKWVFLGDDRNIRKVYVDGRLVAGHDLN